LQLKKNPRKFSNYFLLQLTFVERLNQLYF
jgi:hypothetical protein